MAESKKNQKIDFVLSDLVFGISLGEGIYFIQIPQFHSQIGLI